MTTANGEYKYDTEYGEHTLQEWVQIIHKGNCEKNDWKFRELRPGYGYDNLAVCIGDYFATKELSPETIHNSWIKNYVYWRDNSPWEKYPDVFRKPYSPINDDRRNACTVSYDKLPKEEQMKDICLVDIIESLIVNPTKNAKDTE